MAPTVGKCHTCLRIRDLVDLLEVHDLATDKRWHVCRPIQSPPTGRSCFERVGPASRFAIRLAIPEGATA